MLYFIESGSFAKIGYTKDYTTLKKRMTSYSTDNPNFRLLDTADGTVDDEKRLQALYKDYATGDTEWCFAKKLVTLIWMDYRASKGYTNYYTDFGLPNTDEDYSTAIPTKRLAQAIKADLISDKPVDLFSEFKAYFNE